MGFQGLKNCTALVYRHQLGGLERNRTRACTSKLQGSSELSPQCDRRSQFPFVRGCPGRLSEEVGKTANV
jgi:hypothetical protein